MYRYGKLEFEWDSFKEMENIRKHGVTFAEAVETFFDPQGIQMKDKKHSESELRFYWIGKTQKERILTTRFTLRGDTVRLIGSAEWRKFRRVYEATKVK